MTRATSIEAYNTIKENGLLSKMRWRVYDTLFTFGPQTSGEVFTKMNGGDPVKSLTGSRARLTELRDLGCIEELGVRKCTVTGHTAIEWAVTTSLPVKPIRPEPKDLPDLPLYRYRPMHVGSMTFMDECDAGEWVKYEDVQKMMNGKRRGH